MKSCERCGSHAINEHMHGRVKGRNPELCDVCYWRTQAEAAFSVVNNMADVQFENSKLREELNDNGLVLQKLQDERDKALSRVDRLEEFLGVSKQAKTECIFGSGKPTTHQYYLKNNSCTAISAKDSHCICWRDEGTGPLSHRRHSDDATLHSNLEWRIKHESKETK